MKSTLISRERVEIALNHQEPDRVPIDITFSLQPYLALREKLGIHKEKLFPDTFNRVYPSIEFTQALGLDFAWATLNSPSGATKFRWDMKEYVDNWGIVYRPGETVVNGIDKLWQIVGGPFITEPTFDNIVTFPWIDPNDPSIYKGVEERVRHIYGSTNLAIMMRLGKNIWDRASYMRGQEAWWTDLVIRPDWCIALMNRIADIQRVIYLKGIELVGKYVSVIRLGGDDFGTQRGPLISPNMFREIVKPILASVFLPLKERFLELNPNGKLMFHSCGSIRDFIPDFIDIGVDVLDPVQPNARGMNGLELRQEFGANLSFHGGVDTQNILAFGTLEEVEIEVKRKIEMFAPGGGYILNPSHDVIGDVAPDKLLRLVELGKSYGSYPIKRNFSDQDLLS